MAEFAKHKKSLLAETNADFVQARKKKSKRRAWLFLIFTVSLVGGFIYFAWYPKFLITNVNISGNRVLSTNKLMSSVDQYLNGRFLYILPHRNAFMFTDNDLKNHLVSEYPIVKDIEVRQNVPADIFITITERQPHALWCTVGATSCVFIDTAGYAYSNAPYFSRPLFTVYELPGAELTKKVLDEGSFAFAEKIITALHAKKILVQKIRPIGQGVFEFDVLFNDELVPTRIVTTQSIGADETLSRFFTLMGSDDILKNKDKLLKSVDVRFGNQVVYTFY